MNQSFIHTIRRYNTLWTDRISALPIVILMPHSACNCRCKMCDIWMGNQHARQLTADDLQPLLDSFRKFGTKQILMSGGEALLHKGFFQLCSMLKKEQLQITLLSTGLLLKKYAAEILELVDDVIVSLDGTEHIHDSIRDIPGAYRKLSEGINALKSKDINYRISARTVIHRLNFEVWPGIVDSALQLGLDQVSFLPADLTSQAFNRDQVWTSERQSEISLQPEQLPLLKDMVEEVVVRKMQPGTNRFIAESPEKLRDIYRYYAAVYGMNEFPYRKCNAPWVSTVIEPDGNVRPCFFHPVIGNIREHTLGDILNSTEAIRFRKELDMNLNSVCKRCVCSLNLSPRINPAVNKSIR